jgi:hypothetical protein
MTLSMPSPEQFPGQPRASWGRVAEEALKHPYQSGVLDLAMGTQGVVLGTVSHFPPLTIVAAPLLAFGTARRRNHIKKWRGPAPGGVH